MTVKAAKIKPQKWKTVVHMQKSRAGVTGKLNLLLNQVEINPKNSTRRFKGSKKYQWVKGSNTTILFDCRKLNLCQLSYN